jgi:hypothetical protein
MDPYIEGQVWTEVHTALIIGIRDQLVPLLRPKYIIRAEMRVYLDHRPDNDKSYFQPDLTVAEAGPSYSVNSSAAVAELDPVTVSLPMPEEQHERFLAIRTRDSGEVITVIEILSPANKRASSDGRTEYLKKREHILLSSTGLVEIDLLRGGLRMPTAKPLPPCDYCAIVSRARQRPRADAYCWGLRSPIPRILIPLTPGDADIPLDLQPILAANYEHAGYDYSLDYTAPLDPPLNESDHEWVTERLSALSNAAAQPPS